MFLFQSSVYNIFHAPHSRLFLLFKHTWSTLSHCSLWSLVCYRMNMVYVCIRHCSFVVCVENEPKWISAWFVMNTLNLNLRQIFCILIKVFLFIISLGTLTHGRLCCSYLQVYWLCSTIPIVHHKICTYVYPTHNGETSSKWVDWRISLNECKFPLPFSSSILGG